MFFQGQNCLTVITWPFCLHWCWLRKSFRDIRVLFWWWWLAYDRLFFSNSCTSCFDQLS